jgi:hypothetical protein
MGRSIFPKAPGIAGIIKRNIIIAPCNVYTLLYVSLDIKSFPGAAKLHSHNKSKTPPKKKNRIPPNKYINPILL